MNLRITRVLHFFDVPQVIELRDTHDDVYVGAFTSSTNSGEEYCVVRTDRVRLKALYSKEIDLRSIFVTPIDGYSLRLLIDSDDAEWFASSLTHEFQLHMNVVKAGFYLHLPHAALDENIRDENNGRIRSDNDGPEALPEPTKRPKKEG